MAPKYVMTLCGNWYIYICVYVYIYNLCTSRWVDIFVGPFYSANELNVSTHVSKRTQILIENMQ